MVALRLFRLTEIAIAAIRLKGRSWFLGISFLLHPSCCCQSRLLLPAFGHYAHSARHGQSERLRPPFYRPPRSFRLCRVLIGPDQFNLPTLTRSAVLPQSRTRHRERTACLITAVDQVVSSNVRPLDRITAAAVPDRVAASRIVPPSFWFMAGDLEMKVACYLPSNNPRAGRHHRRGRLRKTRTPLARIREMPHCVSERQSWAEYDD